ncbi:MAG TPA: M14 metallopeptidase family protein, partial [Blastocatellia bacterium]|nr:M14 metallopeptidase family protein [Blastocatellia bacterium]
VALALISALAPPGGAIASGGRADGSAPGRAGAVSGPSSAAANTPSPKDVIGFVPGEDRKLAAWSQIVDYFKALARSSTRVRVDELGKTTLGRPFILATISSPENLARLDRFKEIQHNLADPRTINSDDATAEKLIAEGRTIVLITCGIHSTEVGGNLVSMNIAYRLAHDDSPETREILNNTIVLLVPSLNPDGVDIVKQWYDKTLGTPSEGTSPPELYHHYTGHDNNRDWYAFTQVETQLTIDKVHNVWRPQIVHDIHQQGETGSRFFLPPYVDPWEPNIPPRIQAGVNFMGSTMAWELTAEGKAGVVIDGVYDAWSPARAYQHYHGGIRILSETASARIATPVTIPFEKLTPQIGVDPKIRTWNFPMLWRGGQWTLADIVDYMESGAFALMRNAARYRERWLRDFYLIGKEAVNPHGPDVPFAFVIPRSRSTIRIDRRFWRSYGLARLESILERGDVEVLSASAPFDADGKRFSEGSRIILMAQPYGGFAKTLLERQHYPDIREYPGGPPRRPYDVTAQTLPLLMGVRALRIDNPFKLPPVKSLTLNDRMPPFTGPARQATTGARIAIYKNYQPSMDEGWTRWTFDQLGVKYASMADEELKRGNLKAKYDAIVIPDQSARQLSAGLPKNEYPASIAGGMGPSGIQALKDFVEAGGVLVTLNRASEFAIDYLGVPVKDVLEGIPPRDFYCPGSILKIEVDPDSPILRGAPTIDSPGTLAAWVEEGPALEPTGPGARVIAKFADAGDVLLSGWLLGADKISGKGAIVEADRGRGKV